MSDLSPKTEAILECLRKAVAETLERKRRLGQYAIVGENGQIKKLTPKEIGELLQKKEPQNYR